MNKVIQILVSGKVQGVGFRYFTVQAAQQLDATGWVRNLRDGRVEALVSLDPENVETFVNLLRQGPAHGQVENLDFKAVSCEDLWDNFTVNQDGEAPWSED